MLEKNPKDLTLDDLERLYTESEACDKRIFSEQRTNLQLVAGEHYVREGSKYWNRIRDNKQLTDEQRIKLTKNHIQRIIKIYCNAITSAAPGVAVEPKDEKSLQHQKAAELHYAVVQDWKESLHFEEKIEEWVKNFFEIGEVACKVFWEADDGKVMGYEALEEESDDEAEEDELAEVLEETEDEPDDAGSTFDPDDGLTEQGDDGSDSQQIDESKPVYSGKLCMETIYGYNLKRDPDVGSMHDSPYLIYTHMTSLSAMRARLDDEAFEKLKQSTSYEYTVFDNNTGSYRNTKNQILLKEIYFRPNPKIPKGYFYIYNSHQKLSKGELPHGFFPIIYEACEQQTGNARGHSIIRHVRPCQVELNRCASKVAEHQITIGDDKVFIPSTSKMVQGAMLPGLRVNTFSGQAPTVLPGRTGDQYVAYMAATIDEMYKLAELEEVTQDMDPQTDIYSLLYRNLRYKKKFSHYSDKFERFLCRVTELGLKVTKACIPDEALIPAIGKSEYINVSEFKNADELCHQIKVKARADDLESQMGKQLTLNHFLQYSGSNISRQDIGMAMRISPFLNKEEIFKDFTLDYDNVTNDILALDRGQWRPPRRFDNHEYLCKKLSTRMNQEDYNFLPPQVQQMYDKKLMMHEQLKTKELQDLQAAEAGFIPSGGYQVAMDYYVTEPGGDPNKTKRVRVPSESVAWLLDKLQKQGSQMSDLTTLPGGVQHDIAGMLPQGQVPPRPMGAPGPAMPIAHAGPGSNAMLPGAMNGPRPGIRPQPGIPAPPFRFPGAGPGAGGIPPLR
jgi:hypothetical protein